MKKGVLLINLGSPDSASIKDVRAYLREFLSDPKVLDIWYVRKIILHLFILPFRPKNSAAAYKKIWWKEGSPLVVLTKRLLYQLQKKQELPIAMGMRYGGHSIQEGLQQLKDQGVTDILAIPLYPHYAMSSTETAIEKTEEIKNTYFKETNITYLPSFYNHPKYIASLVKTLEKVDLNDFDALLFSYHGIPERHIHKTDPTESCRIDDQCCVGKVRPSHPTCYRHQCHQTTLLTRKALGLPKEKVLQSYQSRLGNDPWLLPSTATILTELPKRGIKKLAVIVPSFVADCLETLEEIAIEGKEDFFKHGGEKFEYIPCLNEQEFWLNTLNDWIDEWRQ